MIDTPRYGIHPCAPLAPRSKSELVAWSFEPIALLKKCLGPCWCDGAITTENAVSNVSDADMPLSEEAKASRAFGNMPVMTALRAAHIFLTR